MTADDDLPSPLADLMRDRPEAFDFGDIPDTTLTEAEKRYQAKLLAGAPSAVRAVLDGELED